ncbi:hypothetical protein BSL78_25913 [Apostichopus japonicus]|uniref:Protein amnionless n=1 Tax=Stichopus japonicus TaxID=307972 RepID=A0A2G8JNF7_STIJA|nr:hypothetical protein BSL78_25913 [Apostichopus japonicus]
MFFSALVIILVGFVDADVKVWNKNVNFYNQENWDKGRKPCPSDKLLIKEKSTSIFLQTNGTLKELVLPMDGEIILGSDVGIAFSDDPTTDSECPGQDLTFVRKSTESWFNPNNWNSSEFILIESDRVPCEFEDVVFPTNSQFYVGLDQNILLNTLSIDGEVLSSTSQATTYLQSKRGQRQFDIGSNTGLISLSGIVMNKVCSNVVDCPQLACQGAVKPDGSCCSMCGGFLTIRYDPRNFNFKQIKKRLMDGYILDPSGSNRVRRQSSQSVEVSMYMSKPYEDRVQVVLTDNGLGIENGKQASQVTQQINADIMRDPESYGVYNIDASFSEGPGAQVDPGARGGAAAAFIIIALVIAVIIVVSIIFVMFRRQPLSFKRGEPLDADIEMPRMNKKRIQELPSTDLTTVEFDNPIYDKPVQNLYDDPRKEANGSVEDIGSVDDGFYNPMALTP